nr:MAG TPA: hypothetical protein [Crassvirales sp.]DAP30841.1 MAG TPA: hypothetical protein [Crassvirales sp.]
MVTDFSKLKVNLNFKIKVRHKTRAPATKQDKVLTKQIETKCRYDNGKFYVIIPNYVYRNKLKSGVDVSDIGTKDIRLEFTPESFDLNDATRVFTIHGQDNGKYICLIRNESDRIFKKLNKEQYVPFCRNWNIRVRIVRRVGVLYADFRSLKAHNLYYNLKQDNEDE